jgi:DNA-binding transcriptional MerR regulator
MNTEKEYSIRELSALTGVNAVTLRAWERRYGLLKPLRTPKGHRYYTAEHLDHVRRALRWLDRGVSISKVRPLLESGDNENAIMDAKEEYWHDLVTQTLSICERFQRQRLEQFFDEIFSTYPLETLDANFFPAVQDAINRKAHLQFGGIAEEIFFQSELFSELLSRIRHTNANNNGSHLLIVNLDPRRVAIRALLLALVLLEAGYRLTILLEPCGLREIPYILERSGAVAVICHSDGKPEGLQPEAEFNRAITHARVPFFLAGQCIDVVPALASLEGLTILNSNIREARQAVQTQLAVNA